MNSDFLERTIIAEAARHHIQQCLRSFVAADLNDKIPRLFRIYGSRQTWIADRNERPLRVAIIERSVGGSLPGSRLVDQRVDNGF